MKVKNILLNKIKKDWNKIFFDKNIKQYIKFNKSKHKENKFLNKKDSLILIDLFYHPPFIHFWGILANFLISKYKVKAKFFYFPLHETRFTKYNFSIYRIKKIYESLNIHEGINEINFKYSFNNLKLLRKKYLLIKSKKDLQEFKYKGLKIGDLIYDTYLRTKFKPTINLEDESLFRIFYRSIKIFDEIHDYFKNNKVKLVIPSHTNYIQYGLIVRIANKKKIPVVTIHSRNRGNCEFRLKKIREDFPGEANLGYLNYRRDFKKLKNKRKLLQLGKKYLEKRLTGKNKLSYLKVSPYVSKKKLVNPFLKNNKKNIVIFAQCFFDAPHRYRKMIFTDTFEQIKFLLKQSKYFSEYNWYLKPHPNTLTDNTSTYRKYFMKKYKNVIFLDSKISNLDIIKNGIEIGITNHGTIGHELPYYKIPIINTGDNNQIKYNFNLHANNSNQIIKYINEIHKFRKLLNFDKKNIFEFIYMHYLHENVKNPENLKLKDSFFGKKNMNKNVESTIFQYYVENPDKNYDVIRNYLNIFFNKNNIKI